MFPTAYIPIWSSPPRGGFVFLPTGELVDGELELVAPERKWVDELLVSAHHPLTQAQDPENAKITRSEVIKFLDASSRGHERHNHSRDGSGTYHFWMRLSPECDPAVPFAGAISLRVGNSSDLMLYYGHIGYNVYPAARGCHYALRACRMLFELARAHQLNPLWLTTDPGNAASRRTCQLLGAELVEEVDIPHGHPLYQRGQRRKCRYRIDL